MTHKHADDGDQRPAQNEKLPKRAGLTERDQTDSHRQRATGPTGGASAAPINISPERNSENKPRETAKSSVKGLRNTLSVLDI